MSPEPVMTARQLAEFIDNSDRIAEGWRDRQMPRYRRSDVERWLKNRTRRAS